MVETYQIYKTPGKGVLWKLPVEAAKTFNLRESQYVQLHFGSLSIRAKLMIAKPSDLPVQGMGLSNEALNSLNLPQNVSLGIKPVSLDQFQLGPIVGVLTFPRVIGQKKFALYTYYAKKMKSAGLLYVFGPKDIHPAAKTVTGFAYDEAKGTWEKREFPYPDAVMDRMYPNDLQAHRELEKVIGNNRIFNKKTMINKLEFYTLLNNNPFLQRFLPVTKPFLQASDLVNFLDKYPQVFLKPVDGMKGRGIINIVAENDGLLCRYMDGKKPTSEKIRHSGLIGNVLAHAGGHGKQYILQAAVNRMKCQDRPFNFRVMTIKDDSGNWSVPAIFARVTASNGFLTNNSAGGEFILLKDLFAHIGTQIPYKMNSLLSFLIVISLSTAIVLDNEFGPLGKLGLDFVLDNSGKPWLLEANGNPGLMPRNSLSEFPDWLNHSFDSHLAYARFLAGFDQP